MKKANTKLIGAFVFGGALLAFIAVVAFSNPDFFIKKRYFVAYFEQSVVGLSLGAPIQFRGINVGEVKQIDGIFDPETFIVRPRLILEFHPESLRNAHVEEGEYTLFLPLVERGMRASLKSQSLLTGQLYVSLDFHPDKEIRLLGDENDPYPEMPTIDSGFGKVMSKLEDLEIDLVINQLVATLVAAEDLLDDPNMALALERLPGLVASADKFIVEDLTSTVQQLESTLATGETSLIKLTGDLTTVTLPQLQTTLKEMETALNLLGGRLDVDDPLTRELVIMLRQLSRTAKSIESLTDYLEQHPEAILKGKKK